MSSNNGGNINIVGGGITTNSSGDLIVDGYSIISSTTGAAPYGWTIPSSYGSTTSTWTSSGFTWSNADPIPDRIVQVENMFLLERIKGEKKWTAHDIVALGYSGTKVISATFYSDTLFSVILDHDPNVKRVFVTKQELDKQIKRGVNIEFFRSKELLTEQEEMLKEIIE